MQTSVQYTPVQVLQAARRAEAEGKMDYALQFYRHIVEHHGATAEAQEARDGLFRIAEWRWGEARVARRQEGANGHGGHGAHGSHDRQHAYSPPANPPQPAYTPETIESAPPLGGPARLPQVIAREVAKAAGEQTPPAFKARFRGARTIAMLLSGLGWASVVGGFAIALIAAGGGAAEISAIGLLGVPLGVLLGMPAALMGLVLVVGGHLAVAIFESTNATLELLSIERGRAASA
jgi:hypothetical protein